MRIKNPTGTSETALKAICLPVAAFFVWIDFWQMRGDPAIFPLAGLFNVLAQGLSMMEIFFHELGHTAASWSFGAPAVPTFDFQHGGGMTYSLARVWPLQWMVWALWVGGIVAACRHGAFILAGGLAVFLGLHVLAGLTSYYQAVVSAMGHMTEMLLAIFCLGRVSLGLVKGLAEKTMHLVFGYFILGHGITMFGSLYASPAARAIYSDQKGGEVLADLDALVMLTPFSVGGISLAMAIISTLLLLWFLHRHFLVKTT